MFCGMLAVLAGFALTGCASLSGGGGGYNELAKAHDFDYFFPASDFEKTFSTIEGAYEFVKTASLKFQENVGDKRRDKGLAARLVGPAVSKAPVTVLCWTRASNSSGSIDFQKTEEPMDTVLRKAESVLLFFVVFYDGRAVSLSNFYLDRRYDGYSDGNEQVKKFGLYGDTYEADYPIGWTIERAFSYLRKEIS
jgi:hypothetical protein